MTQPSGLYRQLSKHLNSDIPTDTLLRMGLSYLRYRLLLTLLLFGILLLTLDIAISHTFARAIYIASSVIYIVICTAHLLIFKYWQTFQHVQLFSALTVDVLYISLTLLLGLSPNLAIVLLYMVVVLAASLLVSPKKALFLTLLSIIIVVYQQFFFTLFNEHRITFIGNSALITLMFISTYLLAQLIIRRMHWVETLAYDQHQEIVQLQSINQNIVEQISTGCMVIDAHGSIITLNQAALNHLHWHQHKPLWSQKLPELAADLYDLLQQQQLKHIQSQFYYTVKPKNGAPSNIVVGYQPLAADQQLLLLSFDSVQRIHQQAQQLKLVALGQLSASIAHEIRNPLAAISQANDLLMDEGDTEQRLLTEMIAKQCNRINQIIEDTLNMSRQNPTMPQRIQLNTWLECFIDEDLADIAQFIMIDCPKIVDVIFDPQQLRQVFTNLIRNAVRHGHQHQPDSLIHIVIRPTFDSVIIDIMDQGCGVALTDQSLLFTPFFTTSSHGTGLGLYLSKTFCEANQAHLSYISKPHGACFRLECTAPTEA